MVWPIQQIKVTPTCMYCSDPQSHLWQRKARLRHSSHHCLPEYACQRAILPHQTQVPFCVVCWWESCEHSCLPVTLFMDNTWSYKKETLKLFCGGCAQKYCSLLSVASCLSWCFCEPPSQVQSWLLYFFFSSTILQWAYFHCFIFVGRPSIYYFPLLLEESVRCNLSFLPGKSLTPFSIINHYSFIVMLFSWCCWSDDKTEAYF